VSVRPSVCMSQGQRARQQQSRAAAGDARVTLGPRKFCSNSTGVSLLKIIIIIIIIINILSSAIRRNFTRVVVLSTQTVSRSNILVEGY